MSSIVVALAAAEEAGGTELPLPAWSIGLLALLAFAALLGVTWSFRGTHHKYAPPAQGAKGATEGGTSDTAHWPEHTDHH